MRAAGSPATILLTIALCGCAGSDRAVGSAAASSVALPSGLRPVPAGRGSAYRLPALSRPVGHRAQIAGLRCSPERRSAYGIHLELYARRLVLPVPAGIGIAPPQRRSGAYVLGGSCLYPVRTYEPTGVTEIDVGRTPRLGQLFAIWGQPLNRRSLCGFRGPVLAFVGGRPWRGPPGRISLRRHAEIVLEIGGFVAPHSTYRFPPGL